MSVVNPLNGGQRVRRGDANGAPASEHVVGAAKADDGPVGVAEVSVGEREGGTGYVEQAADRG